MSEDNTTKKTYSLDSGKPVTATVRDTKPETVKGTPVKGTELERKGAH